HYSGDVGSIPVKLSQGSGFVKVVFDVSAAAASPEDKARVGQWAEAIKAAMPQSLLDEPKGIEAQILAEYKSEVGKQSINENYGAAVEKTDDAITVNFVL